MRNHIKLYNMILPPYLLMIFVPWLAAISLVGNFVIDSIVLLVISLFVFKRVDGRFYKSSIWKVWGLGFAGDFVGIILLFIGSIIGGAYTGLNPGATDTLFKIMDGINCITNSPEYINQYSYIFLGIAVLVAAIAIFCFDYFIAFGKSGLTKRQRVLSALAYAVFTAPYTFFLPNSLFYA